MVFRRRARRRLVGAVAIALAAILILPMLFDQEPKPLGPDVDIRIPAQETPFEPAPAPTPAVRPAATEPSVQAAEPTLPAPAPSAAPIPPAAVQAAAKEPAAAKPESKPAEKKLPEKPIENPGSKAAGKATEQATDKADDKVPPPPPPKPTGAFASHGFYLQLGAFASENNARQLMEKVTAAGFKPAMADSNGQYRVRVGPIQEKDRALEVQARLKAKGFSSVMLGP